MYQFVAKCTALKFYPGTYMLKTHTHVFLPTLCYNATSNWFMLRLEKNPSETLSYRSSVEIRRLYLQVFA